MGRHTDQFDTAARTVTQDRGAKYGHPHDTFTQMATLQALVAGCPDTAVRHALNMICIKLVRLCHDPSPRNMDSAVDIAGYARTLAMIWDRGKERTK